MNRPLFWAVLAFALGEVTYLLTEGISKAGIVLSMSAFCALICVIFKKKEGRLLGIIAGICYFVGFINMLCDDMESSIGECIVHNEMGYYEAPDSTVYGVVTDISNTADSRCIIVKAYKSRCEMHEHNDSYKLMYYDDESVYRVGDYVCLTGELNYIINETNPGTFERKEYYAAKGVKYNMEVREQYLCGNCEKAFFERTGVDITGCASEKIFPEGDNRLHISIMDRGICLVRRSLYCYRDRLAEKLKTIMDSESYGIYKGILLGDKSDLSDEIRALYKFGGISHILAISSLHITLIGSLLWRIIKKLGVSVYPAGLLAFIFVMFYGVMTGFGIASIRAVIMMLIMVAGTVIGRDVDLLTSLAMAFLITNIAEPARITESAGIMSFSAIIGVSVGNYVIKSLLKYRGIRIYKNKHKGLWMIISSLVYQSSLQLIMLPVTVSIYYEIYPYSFFVNLLVVPLMTVVVVSGFAGLILCLAGSIYGTAHIVVISRILSYPGCILLKIFKQVCLIVNRMPLKAVNVGHIKAVEIILYYLFVALFLLLLNYKVARIIRGKIYRKKGIVLSNTGWKRILTACEIMVVLCTGVVGVMLHSILRREMIVFLDVGQGAGAIIRTEEGNGLVFDGGSSSNSSVGEYDMVPAIKYMGISDIDYWYVSHADTDHISGLLEILTNYDLLGVKIDNIVFYKNCVVDENMERLLSEAERRKINVMYFAMGDTMQGNSFSISCVHPEEDFGGYDANESSLVLSYESDKTSVLFTGDMGEKALECMFKGDRANLKKEYDYITIPHHGSKHSLSDELYNLCMDGTAVISCGRLNSYGHPHKEVTDRLSELNISVWRTDQRGALIVGGE